LALLGGKILNFYKEWALRLWNEIDKLLSDNLDKEELINGLAEALEADLDVICSDCDRGKGIRRR